MSKRVLAALSVVALLAVAVASQWSTAQPLTGGGGLYRVITNSPGLLAGSGTTGNPLTATLTVGGGITGTGSSGSPLTASGGAGDIEGVTAGSGLINGGTSGTVTLDVGAGTGITVGANDISVNLAGASCSNGQIVTAISSAGVGTCSDVAPNRYSGTHLEWSEEFLASPVTTTSVRGAWLNSIANTGTMSSNTGTTTRPGLEQWSTNANAAGRVNFHTSTTMADFGSGSWISQWTGGFSTLSTSGEEYEFLVGFFDVTNAVNQTDGCYFLYDRGSVATAPGSGTVSGGNNWQCWCASGSTRTAYTIGGSGNSDESFALGTAAVGAYTAPSTNIQTLEVRMTGTTRAEFFYNGTKVCNINTNVPTGGSARLTGHGMMMIKSAGTTARTVDIDRLFLSVDLTSARSP